MTTSLYSLCHNINWAIIWSQKLIVNYYGRRRFQKFTITANLFVCVLSGSRGWAGGSYPYWKITKLHSQHSMLGHHLPTNKTHFSGVSLAGRWWPAWIVFGSSLPSSTKQIVVRAAPTQQNRSSGFPTKRDANKFPQLQRLARKVKFRLWQVLIWHFPINEQQRRWSDCADAQSSMCLCCSFTF